MDTNTHREILAKMYGCQVNQLPQMFSNLMPQMLESAMKTLGVKVEVNEETSVYA